MKNSVIIHFFVWFFQGLAEFYNNSGMEKTISRVCDYFKKYAANSILVNFFQNRFMTGIYWRESVIYRAVMFPVRLLLRIGGAVGDRLEAWKDAGLFWNFFVNLFNVPIQAYGLLGLALLIGYTGVGLLFGNGFGKADQIIVGVGAALCCILLFFRCSISGLISGSFFAGRVQKFFTYYSQNDTALTLYHLKAFPFALLLALAAGAFMGYMHPLAAVLSLAAAAGLILVLWKTEIGVFLFVVFAPLLPTMAMVGLIGITAVSFVLRLATRKDGEYIVTPFNMLIIAFLAMAALSSLASVDPASSIKIFLVYLMFTLAFPLIVNTVKTRSSWNILLILFVLCGALVSLYGIYQNYAGTDTTQSWVDTQMFEDIKTRVYSTFDNPNVLGQYLILIIPVAFAMLVQNRGTGKKIIYTLINIAMFACLMYTWSRGAWVGVVLSLGFFVLLRDRRWLVLCVAGLLLMPSVLPANVLNRLTSIGNMKDSSTAYRVSVWVASFRIAKDYWMSGIGIGTAAFEKIYPSYALNGAGFALHSHNFYIQWVVEMGVFGLLAFLAIILTAYKQIASIKEKSSLIRTVTLAMAGALLGFLFQGMAENLWYNFRMVLIFWIYMGILQSGVNISNEKDRVTL